MKPVTCRSVASLAILFLSTAYADTVTPLQLKVMQTRKFAKPPLEVMLAIKTFCQDKGAINVVGRRPEFDANGHPISGSGVITCIFPPKITHSFWSGVKDENKIGTIKGEAVSFDKDSISIRIRIMSGYPNQEQSTNTEDYSRFFKSIGDTIFIEAIQIEAVEQH